MENPKVLVYVPCHNNINYAKECMDSIISQSYPNQEVIVSFNGCTDGTDEFVKKEYPTVKILEYKKYVEAGNPGINTAVYTSDCEFYMQLGMDDKLVPNFWEHILPYFSSDDIGIVRVGCYQFSEAIPHGSWWRPPPFNDPTEILMQNKIFVSSPVRKATWESIGGQHNTGMAIFGDWDFWIQAIIIQGWKWATCYHPMFWYRRHPNAASYNFNPSQRGPAYTALRNKWMWALKKYNIRSSDMASPQMIKEAK
jgi:glycosyltransferase involved in cell wall biosynthesis